jgi:hypothetical protein
MKRLNQGNLMADAWIIIGVCLGRILYHSDRLHFTTHTETLASLRLVWQDLWATTLGCLVMFVLIFGFVYLWNRRVDRLGGRRSPSQQLPPQSFAS